MVDTIKPDSDSSAEADRTGADYGATPEGAESSALKAKIAELEAALELGKDQLLRKAAEFENYKKRTEGEYASLVKYSNEELIRKLLPVLDDLERSLKAAKGAPGDSAAAAAPENVYTQALELIAA